jgi:hypothetical protein
MVAAELLQKRDQLRQTVDPRNYVAQRGQQFVTLRSHSNWEHFPQRRIPYEQVSVKEEGNRVALLRHLREVVL